MVKDIKLIVNNLISKYNTRDVYELCSYLNITIKKDSLEDIKGYFLNSLGNSFIVISQNLEDKEIPSVIAHELGHFILHKDNNICFLSNYTYSVTNKKENEANKFAAELLLDDALINTFIEENQAITYEQMAKVFNVPIEFVEYKMFDMLKRLG